MDDQKPTDANGARILHPDRDLATVIGDLVAVSSRLARLAASETGNAESPAVWRTLAVLRDLGPLRLGELARASRVAQPTMTKLVHALDERGWVRRLVDAADGRAWKISLDPSGLAALDAWRAELGEALAPWFAGLSPDDVDTLIDASRIVHERLDLQPARGAVRPGGVA
ncbi:MarR family winged helix-turn-helix transcriptional regulator [Agromyces seonyuensis]|uniref:MarR family transcriptional regulator n=1 Tax=Agromyces seonyuensis TaxID=2662446 RepID=A0A6I4P0S9_9MICO|nr:MarR family transcriptional regulator [Agromyces seonyuensis]MWB97619.1 MarR family transcriptional regulator [Agromyces seonyuensis]